MSDVRKEVAQRFQADVKSHEATLVHDDGLFRHIACKKPGTWNQAFQITTWPGYLAITGDMGAFTFSRLSDMFAFFRQPGGDTINAGYWREKLVAIDRGGALVYDPEKFRLAILRRYREWLDRDGWGYDAEERRAIRQRLRDEVLARADDGESVAHIAATEFRVNRQQMFVDFWETNLKEYTYHYLWCCHAIVWAIGQYDALKARPAAELEVAHA